MQQDFKLHGTSYQLRYRVCNKPSCRCHEGERHGPYWYAFPAGGGAVYVGKKLPDSVLVDLAQLHAKQEVIKKEIHEIEKRMSVLSSELHKLRGRKMDLYNYSIGEGDPSCLRSLATRPTRKKAS